MELPNEMAPFVSIALEARRRYGNHPVRPLYPGRKEPIAGPDGHPIDLVTVEEISQQGRITPKANIGIVMGQPGFDNKLGFDIDVKHLPETDPWKSIRRLEDEFGVVFGETMRVRTATGGEHRVFTLPEGLHLKNMTSLLPGLDLKAGNGYLVGAGSKIEPGLYPTCPAGGVYEYLNDLPPAPAPGRLMDPGFIEMLRKEAQSLRIKNPAVWDGQTLYPSEAWHDVSRVIEVRMGHGKFLKVEPQLPSFGHGEHREPLKSLFGWLRMKRWPDYETFERACLKGCDLITVPSHRQCDYGDVERLIQDTWMMSGPEAESFDQAVERFGREAQQEHEARIHDLAKKTPSFPVQVFPNQIADCVRTVSGAFSVPLDFVSIPILAITSTAIGSGFRYEVPGTEFRGPGSLFLDLVNPTAGGKDEAAKFVRTPLDLIQGEHRRDFEEATKKYLEAEQEYKSIVAARKADWERRTKTALRKVPPDPEPPFPQLPEKPEKPRQAFIRITDYTLESLAAALLGNPRGIMVNPAELATWITSQNEYKGGIGSDRQRWLELWDGNPVVRLRVDEAGTLEIPHPYVTVYGAMQPDVLNVVAHKKGFDDGFMGRILFSWPITAKWNRPKMVDEELLDGWRNAILKLHALPEQYTVTIDPSGMGAYWSFYDAHTDEINRMSDDDRLRGAWGKFSKYHGRLMLNLHLLRWAVNDDVPMLMADQQDVENATLLIDYFKGHCRKVYEWLASPGDVTWSRDNVTGYEDCTCGGSPHTSACRKRAERKRGPSW